MDPLPIASLITTACNGLVTAAVTDSWEGVRHKVATWFGRGSVDGKTLEKLGATYAEITSAPPGELERIRRDLAREWVGRFKDLIADHPDAGVELEALVGDISPIDVSGLDHSAVAGGDMVAYADHSSAAVNVANAPINVGPTTPGTAR